MNEIPVITSIEGVKLINRLCDIALKAHGFSPSPVEIKELLSGLDPELLEQTMFQTAEVLKKHL